MRILLLTDLYPPAIGGIERHVAELGSTLAARGHEVAVATMHHPGQETFEEANGVRIYRIRGTVHRLDRAYGDDQHRFAPPMPDPELMGQLRRVVDAERPQIVHGHNWMARSYVPLKRRSGAALVMTLHDYGFVCAKRSLVYRGAPCSGPGPAKCLGCAARHYGAGKGMAITLGNFALAPVERRAVDRYLPVSRAVADASRLAADGASYEVIPNFVPDDVASLDGPDVEPPVQGPYLLYVGALTAHKGVHVLLEAYRRLGAAPPLVLMGTRWPDTPTELPPNVKVLTDVPHPAVMRAWRGSLFGVVPSVFPDPCPTVAMEAMASGRALVASGLGGLPDLVEDGVTGYLVPGGDAVALAGAMRRLIDDPAAAALFGAAALAKVPDFMASRVASRIEGAYERALARRAPSLRER